MKKLFCTTAFVCVKFLAGCGQIGMSTNLTPQIQDDVSDIVFISGMGCSDPTCTDTSHHHDCPPDCGDYEHHHNCDLDCTEVSHHHTHIDHKEDHHADSTAVTTVSFVSGMGCNDPTCTDTSHHHDCPPDCGDYEHYHNCGLDCTETSHHHSGTSTTNESEQHHTEQHHEDKHH